MYRSYYLFLCIDDFKWNGIWLIQYVYAMIIYTVYWWQKGGEKAKGKRLKFKVGIICEINKYIWN